MLKKIVILSVLILLNHIAFSQKGWPIGDKSQKKDMKIYKDWFGESYTDSSYSYMGYLSLYEKAEKSFLNMNLNIEYLALQGYNHHDKNGSTSYYNPKRIYKVPMSIKVLELWGIETPIPIDLISNQHALKKLHIMDTYSNTKDPVFLNFSSFDNLDEFILRYNNNLIPPIQIVFPPNLRILATDIPASNIFSIPESIEELYIYRDSSYAFSNQALPNLWLVGFWPKDFPLSEDLINMSSIKNIVIEGAFFSNFDVELLATRSYLDTLTLKWYEVIDLPSNLGKLTNVSIIKLDFYLEEIGIHKTKSIATVIQHFLPNATILYKDRKYVNGKVIDNFIKYENGG